MTPAAQGEAVETMHPSGLSPALVACLTGHPEVLVAALGHDGRLVPVPPALEGHDCRPFSGPSGLELVVAEDQLRLIDAWTRAQEEPVVELEVRLRADPTNHSTIAFFDERMDHDVHVITMVHDDPDRVVAWAAELATRPGTVAHLRKDAAAVILEIDAATTALLGWRPEDIVGRRALDFVHPDDIPQAIDSWLEMRAGAGSSRLKLRHRQADGRYRWVEVSNESRLDDPEHDCVLTEMVDISDEVARLDAIRDRERQLERLADMLPIGVCHIRADREVAYSNERLAALLGPVKHIADLAQNLARPDRQRVLRAVDAALRGVPDHLEVGVRRGDEDRRCELTFRLMDAVDGEPDGIIVCALDVTDPTRLRKELEHRASHDELSGCLNRSATVVALERALVESAAVAVVYLDLDRFKSVNDQHGHAAGDELLRVAATRLRGAARAEDVVGRMGGDEFVVICRRGAEEFAAAALAHRFREAVNGDVAFGSRQLSLHASVGVATSTPGVYDAEALLSQADSAMYANKRRSSGLAPG